MKSDEVSTAKATAIAFDFDVINIIPSFVFDYDLIKKINRLSIDFQG